MIQSASSHETLGHLSKRKWVKTKPRMGVWSCFTCCQIDWCGFKSAVRRPGPSNTGSREGTSMNSSENTLNQYEGAVHLNIQMVQNQSEALRNVHVKASFK